MSEQPPSGSILDRIILSQQADILEHFNPVEIVSELLKQLSDKEADVVRRRFGLGANQPETLEVIGAQYQVTRERVRQIQRWAVERLAKSTTTKNLLRGVDVLLQELFEEHGGLLQEEELLQSLHSHAPEVASTRAATLFILEEMLAEKFQKIEAKEFKPYWKPKFTSTDLLLPTVQAAEQVLRSSGKPLSQEEFISRLRQSSFGQGAGKDVTDTVILSYLNVAVDIDRNPFGEFGLREWGSVVPKRMNDKILMVMRKHGKPLHFQEITQRINEIGFDHRQAYPPTVHNELILNKEYILIGRGIYALKEWGYKSGVVAEVLAAILQEANRPMTREELVDQVMQQRMVKKNTIHLALTNKKIFEKTEQGLYRLASSAPTGPEQNA